MHANQCLKVGCGMSQWLFTESHRILAFCTEYNFVAVSLWGEKEFSVIMFLDIMTGIKSGP